MVQKLGYGGFPDFQAALREELKARVEGPIGKHEAWAGAAPSEHLLNRFTEAVIGNIRHSLAQIAPEEFDAACRLIVDPDRHLHIVGGRITHTLAEYLFLHMQAIRAGVTHIPTTTSTWPHYLLDMAEGDVVVVFDMRRYERNTLKLAEMARERGGRLILFTDQWRSPIHRLAEISFGSRIVVPSAWDSAAVPMLLVEVMISTAQGLTWGETKDRMAALEEMFDSTKLFRKFT
jgi:DNA-binding MurR/RpiR family transcriptional regulator